MTLLTNVLRISADTPAPAPSAAHRDRETVAHFREVLERNYRGHLDVGDYAREIGTSESRLRSGFEDPAYFSRFLAKGMGASPRRFRRSTVTT